MRCPCCGYVQMDASHCKQCGAEVPREQHRVTTQEGGSRVAPSRPLEQAPLEAVMADDTKTEENEGIGFWADILGLPPPQWLKKLPPHMRPTAQQASQLEKIRKQLNVDHDQFAFAIASRPAITKKVQLEMYRRLKRQHQEWGEEQLISEVLKSRLAVAWKTGDMWLTTDEEFERAMARVRTLDDLCHVIIAHEKEGEGIDSTGWVRDRIDETLESHQPSPHTGGSPSASQAQQPGSPARSEIQSPTDQTPPKPPPRRELPPPAQVSQSFARLRGGFDWGKHLGAGSPTGFGWGIVWCVFGLLGGASSLFLTIYLLGLSPPTRLRPGQHEALAFGLTWIVLGGLISAASAIGVLMKRRWGLILTYVALGFMGLNTLVGLFQANPRALIGLILAPAWFVYFQKRRAWFT